MILKDLKQKMILPRREIFINKVIKVREMDVHLLSITLEEQRNVLWVMYQSPYSFDPETDIEEIEGYASNKDEMINNIRKNMNSYHLHISEMNIQKQKITFSSSSASCIDDTNYESYMKLQHFIENGMSTTNWDAVDLSNIVIASYEQKEDEKFPEIDLSKELEITLKVDKKFEQVLINQPISLEFGETEKGKKLYFYDSINNKDCIFYINKMEHYDIWEDVSEKLKSDQIQDLSEEEIEQIKGAYMACIERTCPKGMNLAILEYETEDDIQLEFYSKEYLDKKPVYKPASAFMMLFKSDKELGINGLKSRVCMITPVKKDFNGSIEAELFSWYLEIPEEIITV